MIHRAWLARDVTGMIGLAALGATPPLGAPPDGPTYKVILTWLVQPTGSTTATVTALLLASLGAVTYALRGPRR